MRGVIRRHHRLILLSGGFLPAGKEVRRRYVTFGPGLTGRRIYHWTLISFRPSRKMKGPSLGSEGGCRQPDRLIKRGLLQGTHKNCVGNLRQVFLRSRILHLVNLYSMFTHCCWKILAFELNPSSVPPLNGSRIFHHANTGR